MAKGKLVKMVKVEEQGVGVAVRQSVEVERLIELATGGLDSPHTRLYYARGVKDFLAWWVENKRPSLNYETVSRYKDTLSAQGMQPGNINARLAAIRRMVRQAAIMGLVTDAERVSALQVKSATATTSQRGQWLTKREAKTFLEALPAETLGQVRDRALVALALGSGMRRAELARLTVAHFAAVPTATGRRWAVRGIVGKRNKTRDIPIPTWVKTLIDEWLEAAGIADGVVFRAVRKGGKTVAAGGMTPCAIRQSLSRSIENARANGADVPTDLACHDLRRTFAQLAREGGADLEQIAFSLGHASIATTERYLGPKQDYDNAPADFLGFSLARPHAGALIL
jgi:integrase